MALTDTDRRRFFLATTLTLLALPALWWANQSENSTAPNVAVAGAGIGVDVGAAHDATADATAATSTADATGASATDPSAITGAQPTAAAQPTAPVATTIVATPPASAETEEGPGRIAPVFLAGPSGDVGAGLSEVAVPARPEVARVTTTATFRSTVGHRSCMVPGIINGRTVTIVNLDTSRSVTCTTVLAPGALSEQITLNTSLFAELADLTDAPIPVEIRQ